jgi:hypothetical protein
MCRTAHSHLHRQFPKKSILILILICPFPTPAQPSPTTAEQPHLDLPTQIRLNVQTRLQFLSFVYSTLGSPRDFELTRAHIETLWHCLAQLDDLNAAAHSRLRLSIRDDLFGWLLNQAKSKDQHAISIDAFKLIFTAKIPHLDPNNFSQTALHLYQELFKIYKYSFQQQQLQASEGALVSKGTFIMLLPMLSRKGEEGC